MSNPTIYWIDDDPSRFDQAEDVTGFSVRDRRVEEVLEFEVFKAPEPNLVIIDHFLSGAADLSVPPNVEAEARGLMYHGSIVAGSIRVHWKKCPIVGITAASENDRLHSTGAISDSNYITVVNLSERASRWDQLLSIAKDFSTIVEAFSASRSIKDRIDSIFSLLKCPEEEKDFLTKAISNSDVFEDYPDSAYLFAQWILRTLFVRPGFLLDSRHAGAFLGLNESGLERIKEQFMSAKYAGVFEPFGDRWWSSGLRNLLNERVEDGRFLSSQEAGRKMEGITEEDFLRDGAGNPADCLAYTDETKSRLVPARLSDTDVSGFDRLGPGFDPIRIVRGA